MHLLGYIMRVKFAVALIIAIAILAGCDNAPAPATPEKTGDKWKSAPKNFTPSKPMDWKM